MSGYPARWKAKDGTFTANDGELGTATFMVEGEQYDIPNITIKDAEKIKVMIDKAFDSARQFGANDMANAVKGAVVKELQRLEK